MLPYLFSSLLFLVYSTFMVQGAVSNAITDGDVQTTVVVEALEAFLEEKIHCYDDAITVERKYGYQASITVTRTTLTTTTTLQEEEEPTIIITEDVFTDPRILLKPYDTQEKIEMLLKEQGFQNTCSSNHNEEIDQEEEEDTN